eukprot:29182-Eustigmatos_ZCMA.PRE.1
MNGSYQYHIGEVTTHAPARTEATDGTCLILRDNFRYGYWCVMILAGVHLFVTVLSYDPAA